MYFIGKLLKFSDGRFFVKRLIFIRSKYLRKVPTCMVYAYVYVYCVYYHHPYSGKSLPKQRLASVIVSGPPKNLIHLIDHHVLIHMYI